MTFRFGAFVPALLLASAGFFAVPDMALAQESQAENVAAARSLGIQGVQLADAGNCKEAIEKLSRAEQLYHAPTILGRLGECQVNVGQIVLGTENLNRVVREQLAPNAPKAFRDAQERARKVLDAALPRIAHLTVQIEPPGTDVTLTVGGASVPKALIGVERPTDPGTHEVVANAAGYLPAKTNVSLAEGGRQTVTLSLTPDPNAAKPVEAQPPALPPPVAPIDSPPPAQAKSGSNTLAYVLLGVGAAGIVTGSITGVMAISQKNDLDCPRNECSGGAADDLDSANTVALISTIGFAVGIPAAAVGAVLLITGSSKSEKPPGTAWQLTDRGLSVQPFVGLTGAGVTGRF